MFAQTYKQNPIHLYNPYRAPLLDHYRYASAQSLNVRRSCFLQPEGSRHTFSLGVHEVCMICGIHPISAHSVSFLGLFVLFIIVIEFNELERVNPWEVFFMIYSLGFSLEKAAAMQEHGIKGTRRHFIVEAVAHFQI